MILIKLKHTFILKNKTIKVFKFLHAGSFFFTSKKFPTKVNIFQSNTLNQRKR